MNKNCFREISSPVFVAVTIPFISSFSFPPSQMTSDENPSRATRRLETWPFRRRHAPMLDGPPSNKIDPRSTDYDSELDLTRHNSLRSIFMTDSSKTLQINEQQISEDPRTVLVYSGYDDWTTDLISFGEFFASARFLFSMFSLIEFQHHSLLVTVVFD